MSASSRVAAIDIGTNSVLLLIVEAARNHALPVVERATITRLGAGVDRTRQLDPDAMARTLACLAEYAKLLRTAGASQLDVVGTSALRDAAGGESFIAQAEGILGKRPRVISGDEEARLTFAGALSGLSVEGPVVVVDIGGGSTEVIVGGVSQGAVTRIDWARSLDLGAVRQTERYLRGELPSEAEQSALRQDARDLLSTLPALPKQATWVGVAGTYTTLMAVQDAVVPYDVACIHGAKLTSQAMSTIGARLACLPLAERRLVPGLEPKRADVILAGCLIAEQLAVFAGADEFTISDRGVRWGLVEALLAATRQQPE